MPYGRHLVEEPATSEPVLITTVITSIVAYIVAHTGIDSAAVETTVIGIVALVGAFVARAQVSPVR